MISNVLKRSKSLSGFYTGNTIVLIFCIVSTISSKLISSLSENAAFQGILALLGLIAFILSIVSAVKGFKYYSWVGSIEDELPKKKSKKITQSLKSISLAAAILDCLTIVGIGIFSFIPKIMFISKTKSLKQRFTKVKKK